MEEEEEEAIPSQGSILDVKVGGDPVLFLASLATDQTSSTLPANGR